MGYHPDPQGMEAFDRLLMADPPKATAVLAGWAACVGVLLRLEIRLYEGQKKEKAAYRANKKKEGKSNTLH